LKTLLLIGGALKSRFANRIDLRRPDKIQQAI